MDFGILTKVPRGCWFIQVPATTLKAFSGHVLTSVGQLLLFVLPN